MRASEITQAAAGRRERNKQDKQQRIFAAASELFAAYGYAAVTTQLIAERADVAGGTLFRYAATKAELLLMVGNEDFRLGLAAGRTALPATGAPGAPGERMLVLVTPLIVSGRQNDENTTAYQREVLFGEPNERYRAEALELARELQSLFAVVLADAWDAAPASASRPHRDPALAARTASDVFHLELARAGLFGTPTQRLLDDLRVQFTLIAHGFLHLSDDN